MSDENESEKPGDEGSDGEQLILGKFKTAEDLAKSYSELEAQFTRNSQELAENRRALAEQQQVRVPELPEEDEEDNDQLFFSQPSKATEKVIKAAISPIYDFLYEQQKVGFRTDPDFVKYEQEVDTLINMQPQLKMKPGIVAQVFKMVQGLHFDPEEFKKKVLSEHQSGLNDRREGKLHGSLEGSTPNEYEKPTEVKLSDEEKRVALKFAKPGSTKEEAFKKYAENKAKVMGR